MIIILFLLVFLTRSGLWNGVVPKIWIKQEKEENPLVYYEKIKGQYTEDKMLSQTFINSNLNYTRPLKQDCLVASPSNTKNSIHIIGYDCYKTAYAVCRMFSDTEKTLVLTPPPPPIFSQNTKLPNFNCYLSSSEKDRKYKISSDRDKRENEISDNNEYNKSTNVGTENKLAFLLDPTKENERKNNLEKAKTKFQSDFGDINLSISYPYFFELLWYSQLPCTDVKTITSGYKDEKAFIKRCFWEEKEIECHSIFQMKPTDRGMCCSFNVKGLEKSLHDGKFRRVVAKLQSQNQNLSFGEEIDIKLTSNTKTFYGKPGQRKGLMVFLDNHNDRVSSGTIFDSFTGFITVVDGINQFPLTFQKGVLIQPGYENSIAISAVNVHADSDVRTIPPKKRQCFFSDESPLKLYKSYSQSNCLLECSLDYTRKVMKSSNESNKECLPWFYPINEIKLGFCDPWQTKTFLAIMSEIPIGVCSHCLPDCNVTIYDATISTAPIRFCDHTNLGASSLCTLDQNSVAMNPSLLSGPIQNEFWTAFEGKMPEFAVPSVENLPSKRMYVTSNLKMQNLVFKSHVAKMPSYDAFQKDIALVNFFYEDAYIQQYKMQHIMTLQDFIAQVGGLLSLSVGMSIVSIFEIIWHLFLLPVLKICKFN